MYETNTDKSYLKSPLKEEDRLFRQLAPKYYYCKYPDQLEKLVRLDLSDDIREVIDKILTDDLEKLIQLSKQDEFSVTRLMAMHRIDEKILKERYPWYKFC